MCPGGHGKETRLFFPVSGLCKAWGLGGFPALFIGQVAFKGWPFWLGVRGRGDASRRLVEPVRVGPRLAREPPPGMCGGPRERFQAASPAGFAAPATQPGGLLPILLLLRAHLWWGEGLNSRSSAHKRSQRAALDVAVVGSGPCSLHTTSAIKHFSLPAVLFCECFSDAAPELLWKAGP